jgi:hypothetical protein
MFAQKLAPGDNYDRNRLKDGRGSYRHALPQIHGDFRAQPKKGIIDYALLAAMGNCVDHWHVQVLKKTQQI